MGASNRPDPAGASKVRTAAGDSPAADVTRDCGPEIGVGSWEHLQAAFARAADTADRPDTELSVQRALARAAATAYARRVKAEGLAPEQMLVLVKAATNIHGLLGFGAQPLTSDIVRWSIDAYFED